MRGIERPRFVLRLEMAVNQTVISSYVQHHTYTLLPETNDSFFDNGIDMLCT